MTTGSGTVQVVRSIAELEGIREELRGTERTVGFVPTMGFLHDGHASLLAAARAQCDFVVLSIFVNPKQFNQASDLEGYPRDEERDLGIAAEQGVDLVFSPDADDLYPEGFATSVEVRGLTDVLCGSETSRGAGHFRGVTTVVALLLNLVDPDVAYFGQKDAQQVAVISRMVRDLAFRTQVAVVPTVREPDGLAMSSRNTRLSEAGRQRAVVVPRALERAREVALSEGPAAGIEAGRDVLRAEGLEPEYREARTLSDLREVEDTGEEDWMLAVAVEVDGVRLIDNLPVEAGGERGTGR